MADFKDAKRSQELSDLARQAIELTRPYLENPDPWVLLSDSIQRRQSQEMQIAYEREQKLNRLLEMAEVLEAHAKQNLAPEERSQSKKQSEPTLEYQIKTTAAHYGIKQEGQLQNRAADLMGCSAKHYRTYRNNQWLLSDEKFKSATGKTLKAYWSERVPK